MAALHAQQCLAAVRGWVLETPGLGQSPGLGSLCASDAEGGRPGGLPSHSSVDVFAEWGLPWLGRPVHLSAVSPRRVHNPWL